MRQPAMTGDSKSGDRMRRVLLRFVVLRLGFGGAQKVPWPNHPVADEAGRNLDGSDGRQIPRAMRQIMRGREQSRQKKNRQHNTGDRVFHYLSPDQPTDETA